MAHRVGHWLTFACLAQSVALFAQYPVLRVPHPFSGSRLILPGPLPETVSAAKRTSVILLHGSEGGSALLLEAEASILASQGFPTLLLCYFDCNRGLVGVRKTLRDVDVGIVTRAARWLREQEWSNGNVVYYGFSRGAELTMVLGSLDLPAEERPTALIAHSPSDRYNSYFNWSWREPACWLCRRGQGQCAANAPRSDFAWNIACGPDDETRMDFSRSAWLIDGQSVRAGTRIEAERFAGPVLITVGEKDDTWPPDQTRNLEAAFRAAGRNAEVHYFPEAGHLFGGADENNRRGLVLEFLRRLDTPRPTEP